MRPEGLININTKEYQVRRQLWKWSIKNAYSQLLVETTKFIYTCVQIGS